MARRIGEALSRWRIANGALVTDLVGLGLSVSDATALPVGNHQQGDLNVDYLEGPEEAFALIDPGDLIWDAPVREPE